MFIINIKIMDGVSMKECAIMWRIRYITMSLVAIALLAGCATQSRSVERLEGQEAVDLSGRWNDTDSRMVAEEMVADVLSRPWIDGFNSSNEAQPVVVVGDIRNRSSEQIDTSTFISSIERELINSGAIRFVAGADVRESIREERMDQQSQATQETISRLGAETGADFMMQGQITSTTDAVEGQRVVAYQTNLELINIETNEIVWIGEKEIRKFIEQSNRRL
ncbi:MAG: penicillin-binding protein activator LpoB [Spirochaetota bacterium]